MTEYLANQDTSEHAKAIDDSDSALRYISDAASEPVYELYENSVATKKVSTRHQDMVKSNAASRLLGYSI